MSGPLRPSDTVGQGGLGHRLHHRLDRPGPVRRPGRPLSSSHTSVVWEHLSFPGWTTDVNKFVCSFRHAPPDFPRASARTEGGHCVHCCVGPLSCSPARFCEGRGSPSPCCVTGASGRIPSTRTRTAFVSDSSLSQVSLFLVPASRQIHLFL